MRRRWCCAIPSNILLVVIVPILTQQHGGHLFPARSRAMMTVVDAVVLNPHDHVAEDESISAIATFSQYGRINHRQRGIIDNVSLHPTGIINEWIAAIKEETRLNEEEWRMTMTTGDQNSKSEEYTGEWYDVMADEELDHDEEFYDEDEEFDEIQLSRNRINASLSTLSGRHYRKMQSGGGCVRTTDGLEMAVRGSSPSRESRITVCTQRMKLGSTARRRRRRRLQKQPAVYGVTGGGINFSNRQIILRCQYIRKKCILDGEEVSRIFYGTNVTLYLIGFQFSNATAHDKFGSGSALSFLDNSVITIRDCSFQENAAKKGGGAVLLQDSVLNFRNSRTSRTNFVNNQARFGGAIYSINSTIQTILLDQPNPFSLNDNKASDDGGAIYMVGGRVRLSDFSMYNNVANNGGAGVFIGVDITVRNVDVSYNTANATGGGLLIFDTTINAENLMVTNNRAGSVAGGMYINNSDICYLKNILVRNNTANSTGGILLFSSSATIDRGVLDFNSATYDGGAITVKSSNVTFVGPIFLNNTGGSTGAKDYSATNDSNVVFARSTATPTTQPTNKPSSKPSRKPSSQPTKKPSSKPSRNPSSKPSSKPSRKPSSKPSRKPSSKPSSKPSGRPSSSRKPSVSFQPSIQKKCFTSKTELSNAVKNYNAPATIQTYGHVSDWCVGLVTDFSQVFDSQSSFNVDISKWDTSNATNMYGMFWDATSFNQNISKWDVSKVTDMSYMFFRASSFNQDLSGWNISKVTTIYVMFLRATSFNQNLCSWKTKCQSITTGVSAFTFTACPNEFDPVCGSGPFCYNCP